MKNRIRLIKVKEKHSRIIWKWRNHPSVRKYCFNTAPISFNKHKIWFTQRIKDPKTKIYLAELKGRKIGVIRFDIKDKGATVSVFLNPANMGRHFGWQIIHIGTKKFLKGTKSNKLVLAKIKKINIASQKAFIKSGYTIQKTESNKFIYQYFKKES